MRPKMESERIYKAALPFFARYGYKKTTLEDIARSLDMSNTNIYSYAKSKKDLYEGCINYAIEQWEHYVKSNTEAVDDPTAKLLLTFRFAVGYIIGNDDMMALLKNDPSIFPMVPTIDPLVEYNGWAVQYVKSILEEGIEKGVFRELNVDVASTLLLGWYKYIIINSLGMESLDQELLDQTLYTMSSLLLNGLLTDHED